MPERLHTPFLRQPFLARVFLSVTLFLNLGFQFSSPEAQVGFWERLQTESEKPIFGRVKLSPEALVRMGHLTLSPNLSFDEQKEEIKKWLKATFFRETSYWDQRELLNLEVAALSVMEQGGFTYPLDWSDEHALTELAKWCREVFSYSKMLSPDDADLTARHRAESMLKNAEERRLEEAPHYKKFLSRQKHLRRSCYYCF